MKSHTFWSTLLDYIDDPDKYLNLVLCCKDAFYSKPVDKHRLRLFYMKERKAYAVVKDIIEKNLPLQGTLVQMLNSILMRSDEMRAYQVWQRSHIRLCNLVINTRNVDLLPHIIATHPANEMLIMINSKMIPPMTEKLSILSLVKPLEHMTCKIIEMRDLRFFNVSVRILWDYLVKNGKIVMDDDLQVAVGRWLAKAIKKVCKEGQVSMLKYLLFENTHVPLLVPSLNQHVLSKNHVIIDELQREISDWFSAAMNSGKGVEIMTIFDRWLSQLAQMQRDTLLVTRDELIEQIQVMVGLH